MYHHSIFVLHTHSLTHSSTHEIACVHPPLAPAITSSPILSPQTLLPRHGATRFRSQCQHLCGDAAWDCSTPPFQDREKDRPCLNLFAGCVSSCAECRSDGISGPFHRVVPLIIMLSTMEASDGCLLVHTVLFCLPRRPPPVSHNLTCHHDAFSSRG